MSGAISGPGSLVKVFNADDTGSMLRLRGDNSYSGGTRFYSGNLLIYQAHSLGAGPVTLGGKTANPKHALSLANQATLVVANPIELAGITDATVDGTCPTFAGRRGAAANDPAALAEFNTSGGDLTLSGPIRGTGGLLKTGSHALLLTGVNSYTGPTHVTGGTLSLAHARTLGEQSDVHISPGATLELNFAGQLHVHALYLDGVRQPAGSYSAASAPKYLKGPGVPRN
jgi:autotransporter-associated beta strand protein